MVACAGLKTFASVTATRELSSHTSAGIGLTWQPRAGLGMQVRHPLRLTCHEGAMPNVTTSSLQSGTLLHLNASSTSMFDCECIVRLQILSTREISDTTTADFNWVVGPTGASGVGISISRRGESLITTARIEVGCLAIFYRSYRTWSQDF